MPDQRGIPITQWRESITKGGGGGGSPVPPGGTTGSGGGGGGGGGGDSRPTTGSAGGGDTGREAFIWTRRYLRSPVPTFTTIAAVHDGYMHTASPDDTGDSVDTTGISLYAGFTTDTGGNYLMKRKAIITFPTAAIGWTPPTARLQLHILSGFKMTFVQQYVRIYQATPGNPLALVAADYQQVHGSQDIIPFGENRWTHAVQWSDDEMPLGAGSGFPLTVTFELNTAGLIAFEAKRAIAAPFSIGIELYPEFDGFGLDGNDHISRVLIASADYSNPDKRPALLVQDPTV